MNSIPVWALTEPIDVTLVLELNEARVWLVTRAHHDRAGAPAFTVSTGDDRIAINGVFIEVGENLMKLMSLVDDVIPDERYAIGVPIRSYPYA